MIRTFSYYEIGHAEIPGVRYYDDPKIVGREDDPWLFTLGRRVDGIEEVVLPKKRDGRVTDAAFTLHGTLVGRRWVGDLLEQRAPEDIQRIPAAVAGDDEPFEVFNVTTRRRCFDERRSVYKKWTEADRRPDKLGGYKMVWDLRIDAAKALGSHVFRVEGYDVAIIVSDVVHEALTRYNVSGIRFRRV
jgi:hypothetical protein